MQATSMKQKLATAEQDLEAARAHISKEDGDSSSEVAKLKEDLKALQVSLEGLFVACACYVSC